MKRAPHERDETYYAGLRRKAVRRSRARRNARPGERLLTRVTCEVCGEPFMASDASVRYCGVCRGPA